LFKPVVRPELLRGTIEEATAKTLDEKEAKDVKKRIKSSLTPNKVERKILGFPKISDRKARPFLLTPLRLVVTWVVLTNQPPEDFIVRVFPDINRLYQDWRDKTGCSGLSDEECRSNQEESNRFWSGFFRALIQATPEEDLVHFMQSGIGKLGALIGYPGLDKKIYELLRQASHLMAADTLERIKSALKENPHVRHMINVPELQALILREEARLGWSKNGDKDSTKTLWEGLSPELKETVGNKGEVIRASMEAVGRRGLSNNLEAALKGQLKPRFIESIWHFLQSISRRITSEWEFETSSPIKEQLVSICQWLFRR